MDQEKFWQSLEALIKQHEITIDRPRGSAHPRYPEMVYPLDYGFLEGTHSGDGKGIDIWLGSLPERELSAIVAATDLAKQEVEIKLLLGCTDEEMQVILRLHQTGMQSAILVKRKMHEDE